ncbi:response regulator transcription factor [Oryzicola mucosus]|uniref:Response regulator transcription factor n=1 Tax=Oryzicola mucosus TaxID=2767425 RepID=A0A8J6U568_9HYPH|nr:response regulator transcription factor [Oryzicola mucosus]
MNLSLESNVKTLPVQLMSVSEEGPSLDISLAENFSKSSRLVVVIDSRALDRECFAECVAAQKPGMEIMPLGSIGELRMKKDILSTVSAVLLNVGGRRITDAAVAQEISGIVAELSPVPVILLADNDEIQQILRALECGARGFIPSSVGIQVCIEAIKLALVGGIFVPAGSVMAMRQMIESGGEVASPMSSMFTLRQAEVVEALRRGKANKIIAYELNLRESTVKVHIRNIMKKLKATNRTEVAFKINDLFPGEMHGSSGYKGRHG